MTHMELITTAANAAAASWPDSDLRVDVERGRGKYDAQVVFETGGARHTFDVEAKRQVNVAAAARLASELDDDQRRRFMLVTEHVQPSVAEALQTRRMNYLDAAGNCHIDHPPLLIHVEGRKRRRLQGTDTIRAFTGEGLKVIFVLLLQPELASRSYRDLVALSGASHGVVQYTMKDLERLDFVVRLSRTERRLHNTPDLLDRWAAGYAEHLRPKQSMGTFRFSSEDRLRNWQEIDLDPTYERWGGEPAASIATQYLKPGRLTIYSRDTRSEVMRRLRVVPDKDGAVDVIRTFWPLQLEEDLETRFAGATAPGLLAYADLLATRDPRNAEVAAFLRGHVLGEDGRD